MHAADPAYKRRVNAVAEPPADVLGYHPCDLGLVESVNASCVRNHRSQYCGGDRQPGTSRTISITPVPERSDEEHA